MYRDSFSFCITYSSQLILPRLTAVIIALWIYVQRVVFGNVLKMRNGSKEIANTNARGIILKTLTNTYKKTCPLLASENCRDNDFYFKVS